MTIPSVFQSQWPQSLTPTIYSQIKGLAWRVITTLSGSTFLHNKLATMINPATVRDSVKTQKLDALRVKLFDPKGDYRSVPVHMRAADGPLIEGALFRGESNQAILFALGSGGFFEAIADPDDAAHDFIQFFRNSLENRINILVINTRGVGNSESSASIQGSALDYYAAWSFLETKGLNVLPWGHSLGFRYVIQAAAWKQQEKPMTKVNIVTDRSFDDLANVARQSKGGIMGSVFGAVLQYGGWGGDVQELWNTLRGRKLIIVAPSDSTVHYYTASFHKRIKANPSHPLATVVKLRGTDNSHTRIYNNEEAQEILKEVNLMIGFT